MKTPRVFIFLTIAGSLLSATHVADAGLITNGSFEIGPLGPYPPPVAAFGFQAAGSDALAGWTIGGNGVDLIGTAWQASDGNYSLDMSGNDAGSISQILNTIAGQTYEILFDLAGNPYDGSPVRTLEVSAAAAVQDYTFNITGHTPTSMGWQTESFTFTATGAETTLTFASLDHSPFGPALDNVRAVPEPSSFVLSSLLIATF